jgi:hypothetical protein
MINLFVYSHVVTLDQPISTPQYLMPLVKITLLPSCNNEKKYKPEVKVVGLVQRGHRRSPCRQNETCSNHDIADMLLIWR